MADRTRRTLPDPFEHIDSGDADSQTVGWFAAGRDAYDQPFDLVRLPPLGDRDAQRLWLVGFGLTWTEDALASPPDQRDATLTAALSRALSQHPALLRELLALPTSADRHRLN
jgi:hypothetical protein